MTDSRAEFEAWLKTVGYTGDPFGEAFNIWRAARKAALEEAINVVNEWALAGHIGDKGISGEAMDAIRSLADRSPT